MTRKAYRQGDVLLLATDKPLPADAQPLQRDKYDRVVIAYGERTGHAHTFRSPNVTAYRAETPEMAALAGLPTMDFLLVGGGATEALRHEHDSGAKAEHDHIDIPAGLYEVLAQVQYTPAALVLNAD